jgi:hypothetical protein
MMKNDIPFVLVGNALSVMVAARDLAKSGADVIIVNGSNNWGGHFATVSFGGIAYDAGMVLHEFTSYHSQSGEEDLYSYNPAIRNDAGRFCNTIRDYVNRYQKTHEIDELKMCVDRHFYDDLLIANSLSSLKQLPFSDKVKEELQYLLDRPLPHALHASNKLVSDEFVRSSYQAASLANHGEVFHSRLIENFCKKLLNTGTDNVMAKYHRVPWLPLFYPETLFSYLGDTPQSLPPTVFSYPTGECIGELANKLKMEIQCDSHIRIVNEYPDWLKIRDDGMYEIGFAKHGSMLAGSLAWSSNLGDLLKVLGQENHARNFEKCSFALAFLHIPVDALRLDFTVLSIVDPDIMIYRITNQSRCASDDTKKARIVVEINIDYLTEMLSGQLKKDLHKLVIEELVALGIVEDARSIELVKLVELKDALLIPNVNNLLLFTEEANAVTNLAPKISLLGPSSGFSSSSFNHQILQGLKLCATWGS